MTRRFQPLFDPWLFWLSAILLSIGLIMVTSASIPIAEGKRLPSLHYANHQIIYILLGTACALLVSYLPIRLWQLMARLILLGTVVGLGVLLVPGMSHEVNGSTRWLFLGPVSIQVSEFAKLGVIIYIADLLARRSQSIKIDRMAFIQPLIVLGVICTLLLLEPDFGAVVVLVTTVIGMMFLAGIPFKRFVFLLAGALLILGVLSVAAPYRLGRLTSFLNPWADQYNSGYQLTQALIAFGRGGFWGLGLGSSVQKLLYLPEAHTDFLFAVLAEELGLLGALGVLVLFSLLVFRSIRLGRMMMAQQQEFEGNLAYGIGLWLGMQAMIHMGVNMGILPTKGLTLPLMSYGNNSLFVSLVALGILFRIDFEYKRRYR